MFCGVKMTLRRNLRLAIWSAATALSACGGGGGGGADSDNPAQPVDCGALACSDSAFVWIGAGDHYDCAYDFVSLTTMFGPCIGMEDRGHIVIGSQMGFLDIRHPNPSDTSGAVSMFISARSDGESFSEETTGTWSGRFSFREGYEYFDLDMAYQLGPHEGREVYAVGMRPATLDEVLGNEFRSGRFVGQPDSEDHPTITLVMQNLSTATLTDAAGCRRSITLRPILNTGRLLEVVLAAGCQHPTMAGYMAIVDGIESGSRSPNAAALWAESSSDHNLFLVLTRQ